MKKFMARACLSLCVMAASVLMAQEPEWNPALVKPCDRACLVGFMERYMNAIYKRDPKLAPPFADLRSSENRSRQDSGDRASLGR